MKRIRSLSVILIVLGIFFAAGVPLSHVSGQTNVIKIGALGPLAITPGKDMEAGAELAVKEINDAGGVDVGGTMYDIELIVETTSDPASGLPHTATAITSLTKLLDQDDVTALLGAFRTEVALAIMAELDRPFLGVGTTAPLITPYFWRTGPSNGTQLTRSLIDLYAYGMSTKGVKKVTIVRENAGWTIAMRDGIKFYLSGIFKTQNFTDDILIDEGSSASAVSSALSPVAADVDALMVLFSGPAGKHITESWASLDMTQFLAGINVESQSSTYFDETEGKAYGEIELETLPPDVSGTSKTAAFRTAFEAANGELPTYTSFASYDSVYILKNAIENADALDAASIQTALATTDHEGAGYWVKYTNENGSQLGRNSTGHAVPIPGAPTGIKVHDLFSRATVGVREEKYIQGHYAQWQQNGTKKTIWGDEPVATRTIGRLEWPIVHAEHGWTSKAAATPAFEIPFVLLVLASFAALVRTHKRKRR